MTLQPQPANPRDLTAGMNTAVAAQTGEIVFFYKFDFYNESTELEDVQYFCSAPHDIVTTSALTFSPLPLATYTWTGIGGNLGFKSVQESTDLAGNGVDITLGGVLESTITLILGRAYIGRTNKIWMGHFNSSGAIIVDPKLIFSGRMNGGFEIDEKKNEGEIGTIDITCRCTDRLGDLNVVKGIQTNEESHQKVQPGDRWFSFVQSLMGKTVKWNMKGPE